MDKAQPTQPPLSLCDHVPADVQDLLRGTIATYAPNEIRLITIDGWFGSNWLGFAGKTLGAFGVRNQDLVIPPFIPARVLREEHRSCAKDGWDCHAVDHPLHIAQTSEANLTRKLHKVVPPGTLLAWCGHTPPDRTALMVYLRLDGSAIGWHVATENQAGRICYAPTGLTRSELEFLRTSRTRRIEPS